MTKWLFIGILLASCHSEKGMKSVSYDGLLNDESSKVWLVDQSILENANVGAYQVADKDVLIFHRTGQFQYTPLKKMGTSKIPTGNYSLDSDKKVLSLYFKKEVWRYNLTYIEEDSIFLMPSDDSETRYALKIIPLPLL